VRPTGRAPGGLQPLSPREYGELAKWLNSRSLRPSDLLTDSGKAALAAVFEASWSAGASTFCLEEAQPWLLHWSDGHVAACGSSPAATPRFPKRLKLHLKHAAPPLLYGAGEKSLLELGGLAIIGSRDATWPHSSSPAASRRSALKSA
jgi:hypothetical protein